MQCEILFQRLDLIVCLKFLPETDDRIQRQHEKDNDKVFPMPNYSGEYRGNFDHPGDWPPKERQEPLEGADALLLDGVRTVLLEPVRRFFLSQTMFEARTELGEALLDRPGISVCLRTLGRTRPRRICLGCIGRGPIRFARIGLRY